MFQRAPMSNHSVLYTNETSSIAMGASHFSQDGIIGGEGRWADTFRVNAGRRATVSRWDKTSPSPTSKQRACSE